MSVVQVCRNCEKPRTPPIEGPCPHCFGYYRTVRPKRSLAPDEGSAADGPVPVGDLLDRKPASKRPTGLPGLDHVFGGGVPEKGTILFCAREGTGKTSLLFETFLTVRIRTLLISTEQNKGGLADQFARFGEERIRRASKYMHVETATELDDILDIIEDHKPKILGLDSLHDVEGVTDDNGNPITSSGDRAVTRVARLVTRLSYEQGFFAFLVGHMSNDGTMMGGAHLRHAVDGTLLLERLTRNRKDPRRRLLFEKSRFAPSDREALFRMTETGFKDCGPYEEEDEDKDPPTGRPPKLRLVN